MRVETNIPGAWAFEKMVAETTYNKFENWRRSVLRIWMPCYYHRASRSLLGVVADMRQMGGHASASG